MQIQSVLVTVTITAAVYLSGCRANNTPFPTTEQMATSDFGRPLTVDWQEAIKGWFTTHLKDPLSAQYVFKGAPQKGYIHTVFNTTMFDYLTVVEVNYKDSYGGYVGFLPYLFIFRNNHIIKVAKPGQFSYDAEARGANLYLD
jgi:hypothetical protein